jgi:sugar phosphate isomerase/epimerase
MKLVGHVSGKELLKGTDTVERIVDLGIGVEIQLTSDVLDSFTLRDFYAIKKIAKDLPVTIHAPFLDLNAGATDSYVLEATRKRFQETILISKVLEAEVIVFHTGFHPAKTYPIYERWLERAIETFELLAKEDVKIALENVFDEVPEHLLKLTSELPKNVGICIDLGHLNIFSEVPLEEWFETFKERIFEFHVHDNDGKSDSHLPIGEGNFNFEKFFNLLENLNNDFIFNLENKCVQDVEKSLEVLSDKGYKNLSRRSSQKESRNCS